MYQINIDGKGGKRYIVDKGNPIGKILNSRRGGFNLLCFSIFTISALIVLIFSITAFFHRVYYKPKAYVNENGSVVTSSYRKEVTIFLYSPNRIMENSGIRVKEGDQIKISASGAFHTDSSSDPETDKFGLAGMYWAAKKNVEPNYIWYPQYEYETIKDTIGLRTEQITMNLPTSELKAEYLSNRPIMEDEVYGTLLVGIMDRYEFPLRDSLLTDSIGVKTVRYYDFSKIRKDLKAIYHYKDWEIAQKSGVLHFTINDSDNRPEYYSDNLGEALVTVEIKYGERNLGIMLTCIGIMIISGLTPYIIWCNETKRWRKKLKRRKSLRNKKS